MLTESIHSQNKVLEVHSTVSPREGSAFVMFIIICDWPLSYRYHMLVCLFRSELFGFCDSGASNRCHHSVSTHLRPQDHQAGITFWYFFIILNGHFLGKSFGGKLTLSVDLHTQCKMYQIHTICYVKTKTVEAGTRESWWADPPFHPAERRKEQPLFPAECQ